MTDRRANDGTAALAVCVGGKYTGFGSVLSVVHPLAVQSESVHGCVCSSTVQLQPSGPFRGLREQSSLRNIRIILTHSAGCRGFANRLSMPSRRLRPHDHHLRKHQRSCSVAKGTYEFRTRQVHDLLLSVASFYGISGRIRNVGQSSLSLPPTPLSSLDHFARQLCDFSALKQQQQSSKQKHESSSSILQASSRAAASPVPGSTSPTRLRPRSQHGSGNTTTAPAAAGGGGKGSSNGVRGTSPSAFNTSPDARNAESTSPLRLSSPNSPPLTHKNYKVSLRFTWLFKSKFPLDTVTVHLISNTFRFMLVVVPA
jgi:hypothetical protein